jgi:hypothetical protein
MRLTIEHHAASTSATDLPAMTPTAFEIQNAEGSSMPTTRMTAAEKLNNRPKAETVNYTAFLGDSAYHSQDKNEDRAEEEAPNFPDPLVGDEEEDLLGTDGMARSLFGVSLPQVPPVAYWGAFDMDEE